MRFLVVLLLLSSVFAWQIDGVCDRESGESCMNHPDCTFCNITSTTDIAYFDTYVVLSIHIKNYEPAELPLILSVKKQGKDFASKQLDLLSLESTTIDIRMDREPTNQSVIVEILDRDIRTAWNFQSLLVLGLENTGTTDVLTPVLGVFLFLGILFFGFKQIRKQGSAFMSPAPPVFMPPPPPPAKEEIIVVAKKKKYYYKKN
ncbi:MAG: hypothetical protein GOV01_01230 [Candidatus Altiarchaeota archaeon]|nr:hypothetical protein [Candidatus Altiarchaeota archaeon]